jgi:dCTP deaminase
MFLSDRAILAHHPSLVEPLDARRLQPAGVDLTLGPTLLVPTTHGKNRRVDLARHRPGDLLQRYDMGAEFALCPGAVALGCTAERVSVPPDLIAFVNGKSSLGRLFLAVHVTAGVVDPGFAGEITLEIVNLSPWTIILRRGMDIAQISFARLSEPAARPYGDPALGSHYQHQAGPTAAVGEREKE